MSEDKARAAVDIAMERYAEGDESQFAVVYDLLAPRLYGYLVRQVRDRARAEDLIQQTFLQMHRARGSFLKGAEVTPWAFAIARRLMIDGMRRSKREVLASDLAGDGASDGDIENRLHNRAEGAGADPPGADDLVQARQVAERIATELSRLPENQRVAFELIKQEGLSIAEAAEVLGTTTSAVKLRAHRAYETLRKLLGDLVAREEG